MSITNVVKEEEQKEYRKKEALNLACITMEPLIEAAKEEAKRTSTHYTVFVVDRNTIADAYAGANISIYGVRDKQNTKNIFVYLTKGEVFDQNGGVSVGSGNYGRVMTIKADSLLDKAEDVIEAINNNPALELQLTYDPSQNFNAKEKNENRSGTTTKK